MTTGQTDLQQKLYYRKHLKSLNMVVNEKWNTIFVVIELVVCFLGLTLNGVVILTIYKTIHRRISAPTYLILSIAVSDFISCAMPVPLSKTFSKGMAVWFGWVSGSCLMISLLALVSITHLAAISAGKCLTITKSLSRDSYFNKKKVRLIILGSWIYSLTWKEQMLHAQ